MEPTTLSLKGITTLTQASRVHVILQVFNLQDQVKEVDNGKAFVSEISDGYAKLKCYWDAILFDRIIQVKNHFNGAIVELTEYSASSKKVLVHDFKIIYFLDEIIGNPVNYKEFLSNNLGEGANNRINMQKVIKYQQPKQIEKQVKGNISSSKTSESQNIAKNVNVNPISMERIKTKGASHYQTIEQLYTGLDHWTLFCRVNKVNFREFNNKKGSLTQLLEFELRDKDDWTIKCTIFGQYASKMSKNICQGQVYTFSQGNIKVDTYRTPAHSKESPFTINFTENSKILLATNDDSIKQKQNSYNTISNIKSWTINGQIDIACILKQIKPESVYVNKTNNQTHPKRVIVVCDPMNNIQVQVTFWRENVKMIDESLINKTIALQSFKVNEYNGKLSLTASMKSKMFELRNHKLNSYEGKINSSQFESISFKKGEHGEQKQNISTIKKLIEQSENLRGKQVLWSTFKVYLNRAKDKGKKMYSGCPLNSCKKAVQEFDLKCGACAKAFDKPTYRYILGIEIADSLGTGSLWTTAYDDFCKKILSFDQDLPADKAKNMSDQDFNQIMKRCYYQEFKVTVSSRVEQAPDYTRRIKHQISSYSCIDHAKEARLNLEKIKSFA